MNVNKEAYNKIADKWGELRGKMPLNQCVIDFSKKIHAGGNVLDIGCGTGYPIAQYLSEQGFFVTGIDLAENMIEKAHNLKLKNAEFYLCDFFDFQPKKKFDAIIAFDSLFHFPLERQRAVYRIISDWLKYGGYLLFTHGKTEVEIKGVMFEEEFYYSSLSTPEFKKLLCDSGFIIESLIENYHEQNNERDLLVIAKKVK